MCQKVIFYIFIMTVIMHFE